jgi:hypothetical protein
MWRGSIAAAVTRPSFNVNPNTKAGLASGSQDADLGSTGRCFNLQRKLLYFVEGNAWAKTVPSGG